MRDGEHLAAEFAKNALEATTFNSLEEEGWKTCRPELSPHPVELEPPFEQFDVNKIFVRRTTQPVGVTRLGRIPRRVHHLQLRFRLQEKLVLTCFEEALRSLGSLGCVFSWEVVGNKEGQHFYLTFHSNRAAKQAAIVLRAILPSVQLSECSDPLAAVTPSRYPELHLHSLYPTPPYSRAMTTHRQLSTSPIVQLANLMSQFTSKELAFFQVIVCPAVHDWKRNIETTRRAEKILGNRNPFISSTSSPAKDVAGRRILFASCQLGCLSGDPTRAENLLTFFGAFHYGGSPFRYRSKSDYAFLKKEHVIRDLRKRTSHSPGVMVTDEEAATFAHLPDATANTLQGIRLDETSSLEPSLSLLRPGLPLGTAWANGRRATVSLPAFETNQNMYVVGNSGSGKSTSLVHQMLWRIGQGHGVTLIDPHGDTAKQLVELVPEEHAHRVVWFNPADPDHILQYNPFRCDDPAEYGPLAIAFVDGFRASFESMGHRSLHVLAKAVYGLFVLGENFAKLTTVLAKTPEGQVLRNRIIKEARNAEVRRFFKDEFPTYRQDALTPIFNKSSNVMLDDRVHRILSQRDGRVRVTDVMCESRVLVVTLPVGMLGAEIVGWLGSMLISQYLAAGLARASNSPEQRRQHYLIVDEFHRFGNAARTLEGIINECRKYKLFVVAAHQETGQIPDHLLKALFSATNAMVFNVNIDDATRMSRLLNNRVSPSDLVSLGVGEVYAKLSRCITHLNTFPPDFTPTGMADEIIARSRELYYRPVAEESKRPPDVCDFDTL